jgi:DNA-directed RNA polymerase subunit RPC12/RpoP
MANRLLELLFGCSHKRLSRPVTPRPKRGTPKAETYVVCLDCGAHLAYDMTNMQIGKKLDS